MNAEYWAFTNIILCLGDTLITNIPFILIDSDRLLWKLMYKVPIVRCVSITRDKILFGGETTIKNIVLVFFIKSLLKATALLPQLLTKVAHAWVCLLAGNNDRSLQNLPSLETVYWNQIA